MSYKYHKQLGGDLVWDEESNFENSEDVATSADMLLRYVAAVLDQQGVQAVRSLAGTAKPTDQVLESVFAEVERRKFRCRFPHLLLGARYWLPYEKHLIMEDQTWRGEIERFASLFQLNTEIKELRGAIAEVAPSATAWPPDKETLDRDVVAAAWQASDTVSRLCGIAMTERLPLWTTGQCPIMDDYSGFVLRAQAGDTNRVEHTAQ